LPGAKASVQRASRERRPSTREETVALPEGQRELLARAAQAFAKACEVEQRHHARPLAHQARAVQSQVREDEARHALGIVQRELRQPVSSGSSVATATTCGSSG
jgi:hypothetical protein